MQKHIRELDSTKPIIESQFDEIVLTPHGDFDHKATLSVADLDDIRVSAEIDRCLELQEKRDSIDNEVAQYIDKITKEFDKIKRKIKTTVQHRKLQLMITK